MNNETMAGIIVLAHEPIDPQLDAFTERYLNHCEWVIYDGPRALQQAEIRAKFLRDYFHYVQLRRIGKTGDVY